MLPPVAIILNSRFIPQTAHGPFNVGASHFSLVAARALKETSCFLGFLLYRRIDNIGAPVISHTEVLEQPAYNIDLALSLDEGSLRSAIQAALDGLISSVPDAPAAQGRTPTLYHQTGVLLPYSPHSVKNLVTHHGPFVSDVIGLLGEGVAKEAFQGGTEKLKHLEEAQKAGLDALRLSPKASAFEFSAVQVASLLERGVPQEKILRTVPPVIEEPNDDSEPLPTQVMDFLSRVGSALLLVTAVARVDAFKNIDLLIAAALQLKREGADIAVLIAGGSENFAETKSKLINSVPIPERESFLFVESFPRNQMLSVFRRVRQVGVFILPSVFETFGFTALEAMYCGLTTIVPNRPRWIGVAEYVPEHLRFEPSPDGLAGLLKSFLLDRSMLKEGARIASGLRLRSAYQRFKDDLLQAIAEAPDC